MDKKNIVLFLCAALIIFIPLMLNNGNTDNIGGTDDAASSEIQKSGYTPWFESLWEPPSDEIETLLFAGQAAIGLIIIAFFVRYYRRKQNS